MIHRRMNRTIWLYGFALAILTVLLKSIEYRYHLRDLSVEFYIGLVALLFTVLGIWVGFKLFNQPGSRLPNQNEETAINGLNLSQLESLGISPREYEVLQLIAQGHTNQEIADQLFISLNTVKTHSSNLFAKLDVKRRTQAVQKAKELEII